jgi:hypothetical protein
MGNCLVKYHYFMLYVLFIVFGVANGGLDLGIAVNIAVIIGTMIWGTLIVVNGHYLRKEHTVRAVFNCISVIIVMALLAIQGTSLIASTQNITPSTIVLTVLYLSFGVNAAVFIRIEYRRRKNKR